MDMEYIHHLPAAVPARHSGCFYRSNGWVAAIPYLAAAIGAIYAGRVTLTRPQAWDDINRLQESNSHLGLHRAWNIAVHCAVRT